MFELICFEISKIIIPPIGVAIHFAHARTYFFMLNAHVAHRSVVAVEVVEASQDELVKGEIVEVDGRILRCAHEESRLLIQLGNSLPWVVLVVVVELNAEGIFVLEPQRGTESHIVLFLVFCIHQVCCHSPAY